MSAVRKRAISEPMESETTFSVVQIAIFAGESSYVLGSTSFKRTNLWKLARVVT